MKEPARQTASAITTRIDAREALSELTSQLHPALPDARPSAAVILASPHFDETLPEICLALHETLGGPAMVGMSADGVIHGETEHESLPALACWVAAIPGVVRSFHLAQEDLTRLTSGEAMIDYLRVESGQSPVWLLLGDPYSFHTLELISKLDEAFPGRPAFGGLASAGEAKGQNLMIFDGHVLREGLSGLAICGENLVDIVVSHGCKPIGKHLVITRAEGQVIQQLAGRPPLAVLQEVLETCPAGDRALAKQRGLLIGRVVNEARSTFTRSDFLIRNPIGIDADSGAMAVNDLVRAGQTIQFHVSDATSADHDLREQFEQLPADGYDGALLFACNGRGTRLFASRHHDARAVVDRFGPMATAGCFCAGEIGPLAGQNHLHGLTASIALFRKAARGS